MAPSGAATGKGHTSMSTDYAIDRRMPALATLDGWLRIALIATIVFGAVARFAYLDKKVYSHDETLTSLRTSGYLESEYKEAVAGRTQTVARLQLFQHANAQRGAGATIRALAIDDPQHPPLYYLLERWWDALFGGSIFARRSLGALFGLLTIPALYWLCRELAPRVPSFPLVATALFAISPFQLAYTQQAREYTLWGLICVVSSALLLYALRTNRRPIWIAYALSLGAGMYAHTFFAFVVAAHAVTLVFLTIARRTTSRRAFLFSVLAAGCAYAPWAYNLIQNRQTVAATNTWFAAAVPAPVYFYKILFNVGSIFFDAEYANVLYSIILLPLAASVLWSLYVVSRADEPRLVLVPALFWTTVIPLFLQDLVHHESRATVSRYFVPAFIALELAVSFWIADWLIESSLRGRIARLAAASLLLCGLVSWAVSARATSWYTASNDAPVLSIAERVTARPDALILTDDSMLALQLSNYMRPSDRFIFTNTPAPQFFHSQNVNRFLIEPSPALCAASAHDPGVSIDLAYEPPFTDSPMLHMSVMDAPVIRTVFSALRKKMTAIHGDITGMFRVWSVSASRAREVPGRCH